MASTTLRNKLVCELRRHEDKAMLVLSGELTEDSNFEGVLADLSGARRINIDTFGISRVNSIGVRLWINFLNALEQLDEITLTRCSPLVVKEMNSVCNFRGRAQVKSVVVPFFCSRCDKEQHRIIDLPDLTTSPAELISGSHRCSECGEHLEFDDLPERYFMFLGHPAQS